MDRKPVASEVDLERKEFNRRSVIVGEEVKQFLPGDQAIYATTAEPTAPITFPNFYKSEEGVGCDCLCKKQVQAKYKRSHVVERKMRDWIETIQRRSRKCLKRALRR